MQLIRWWTANLVLLTATLKYIYKISIHQPLQG